MRQTTSTVFVLTAVHNGIKYTKDYLKCLKKQNYKHIVSVLIDDGSSDETADLIKRHYPETVVLKGNGNLWWTGSLKKGISYINKHAKKTDYVVTINNDCAFAETYIGDLLKIAQNNKNSIIGSLVLDRKTRQIIDAGVRINWPKAVFEPIKKTNKADGLVDVDTLSTKGTIFPISIFNEIGNFDAKKYPHYLSDYEFACRAKKHGYRLMLNNTTIVLNDNKRTGIEANRDQKITFLELYMYMKSKKSKINIFDQLNFFKTYCPSKYKPSCYFEITKKIIYLISLVPPLYYFRKIIICKKK